MTLLLFNYAIFNNPILLYIGFALAALEATTAVLQFFKVLFGKNEKIVKKIDKTITKLQNKIGKLKEKEAYYRADIAYKAEKDEPIPVDIAVPVSDGVDEIAPPEQEKAEPEEDYDAETIEKENAEALAEHERNDFDTREYDDAEAVNVSEPEDVASYELFKKFVAQVKKND